MSITIEREGLMTTKIFVFLLVSMMLLCNPVYSRDVLDAHTWAGWEYEEKRKFALGFIEGQRVTAEAIEPLVEQIPGEVVKVRIKEELNSLSFDSYAVQLVDDVEAFYMDFDNKDVTIGNACAAVIRSKN